MVSRSPASSQQRGFLPRIAPVPPLSEEAVDDAVDPRLLFGAGGLEINRDEEVIQFEVIFEPEVSDHCPLVLEI